MKDLPVRKNTRLKGYDYSRTGCYFITICVKNGHEILVRVFAGDGALDVPYVQLTEYGYIVEKHIVAIDEHYDFLAIQKHVIIPNHIHMLIAVFSGTEKAKGVSMVEDNGTSRTPSPTNTVIPSVVSVLKRFVHRDCGFTLFQRSYHDHIVQSKVEHQKIWRYKEENPAKWKEDYYYQL